MLLSLYLIYLLTTSSVVQWTHSISSLDTALSLFYFGPTSYPMLFLCMVVHLALFVFLYLETGQLICRLHPLCRHLLCLELCFRTELFRTGRVEREDEERTSLYFLILVAIDAQILDFVDSFGLKNGDTVILIILFSHIPLICHLNTQ